MDMTGERRIIAPRQVVWDALNDTATLKASIPGCESLEKTDDTHMKATASIKLGPIAARFNGAVTLSDIDAPNGYTISGEGQGGVAGFAKGGAKVFLTDDAEFPGGATLLRYEVNAQVGGKLAQLGARLIDATAKQMAEQFFTKFSAEVQKLVPAEPEAAAAPQPAMPAAAGMEQAPLVAPATGALSAPVPAPGALSAPAPVPATPASPPPAAAPMPRPQTPRPETPPSEVRPPPVPPPSAVSPLALIPREAFGLPLMGWLGIAAFAVILLFILMSML